MTGGTIFPTDTSPSSPTTPTSAVTVIGQDQAEIFIPSSNDSSSGSGSGSDTPLRPSVADAPTSKATHFAWLRRLEIRLKIRPAAVEPLPTISQPLFPKLTTLLTLPVVKTPMRWRWLPFWIYIIIWIAIAAVLIQFNNYKATTAEGQPSYVSCTTQLWAWQVEACGPGGMYCKPFANQSFTIRCPSECLATRNQNQRWLGASPVGFMQPWVVGDGVYRAESWLCASAIHAGVVSAHWGGCAAIDVVGEAYNFPSVSKNGVSSLAFDSWFPKSYRIRPIDSKYCTDFSWAILPVALVLVGLFPLVRPSRGAYIFAIVTAGFWHVIFVGIPIHDESWTTEAWGRYLVALAFVYFLYAQFLRFTVPSVKRFPIDLFFFYVLPFYFALHLEIITAPLSNFGLTSRAFREPTTLIVFIIGVPIVVCVCLLQLFFFRRHGMLATYLFGYGLGIVAYFLLPFILSLHLHLHHYTLGLLVLPLTRIQTRPSLLAQGFLLGLVIQGLARWGPASPFDTSFQNLAGDEAVWVPRPTFAINPTALAQNATISWKFDSDTAITLSDGSFFDSFSLLLNDMEVYRGTNASVNLDQLKKELDATRPYYARVALVSGGSALEYAYPVVIRKNGTVIYQNGTVASP